MVVALDGLERRDLKHGVLPSGAHLAAALVVSAAAGGSRRERKEHAQLPWQPAAGTQIELALRPQAALPDCPAVLSLSLQTLANFAHNGCLVTVPLLLAGGMAMSLYAGRLWWQRTGTTVRLAPPPLPAALGAGAAGAS